MTIADTRPRTEEGQAHSLATLAAAGIPNFFLRPGEVAFRVVDPAAGPCSNCHRTLASVQACWDRRITSDTCRPGPWRLGEDTFPALRHADGNDCQPWVPGKLVPLFFVRPQCPRCQTYDSLVTAALAYGNETTCTVEGCTYRDWYDIGD